MIYFTDESSDEDSEAVPRYTQWGSMGEQHGGLDFENESDEGSPEEQISFSNKTSRLSESDQSNSADDEPVHKKENLKFESMTTVMDNSYSPYVDKPRATKRRLSESDSDNEPDSEQHKVLNFKRLATEVNSRPAYDGSKAMAMMVIIYL